MSHPHPLIDLSFLRASALGAGLCSWIRQERRSLPSRGAVRSALITSLLLLSPLLALELVRRSTGIRQAQQLAREDALEILHAAQGALSRTTRDWAQWDDTYGFITGRNPAFARRELNQAPIFDDGTVMLFFDQRGRLLHSHGQRQRPYRDDRSLQDCAHSNLPHQALRPSARVIPTMVPLLCRSSDGASFLGMAAPISDSQAIRPPQGTLVLLSPLLRADYGPHLLSTLRRLEQDLIVLPAVAPGQRTPSPSAIEAVTGNRLYSREGRLVSLRPQGIWLELSRSFAEQSLLLLSLLLLLLSCRALLMLDRRRQLLLQRRQDIQANRRIRRLCQELDDLLLQMGVDTAQAPPDARVLARLIGREAPAASFPPASARAHPHGSQAGSEPMPTARSLISDDARVAERMRRITERFQCFLGSARRLALCDALTQLPNRRYFLEYLNLEAERQRAMQGRFAVLFVDIDKFKAINDTYGHAVGDQALLAVAERLRGLMRSGDFLARYGGDEFVVLMPLKPSTARQESELRQDVFGFASRIAASFQSTIKLASTSLEINLSLGVSIVNPSEINPEEAIRRSDEAMYRAKLHKISRIAIFSVDDAALPSDHDLADVDLIKAARSGDLTILLQPVVDAEGMAHAVEALARWFHPLHGEISSVRFLALAEHHRQMPLLGEVLLDRSLKAFQQVAAGLSLDQTELILALNLSPLQLRDPALADQIGSALERHGLAARHLSLELHESVLSDHGATVRHNLEALRRRGMRVAIDAFGTGHGSLQLLDALRPDAVKIDQTFVQAMTTDPSARRIVEMLAGMAPLMGVEIVAEGVEQREAFEMLREMGVNRFQGHLFAAPLAPEQFSSLHFPLQDAASPSDLQPT